MKVTDKENDSAPVIESNNLSCTDFIWQTLRLTILGGATYGVYVVFELHIEEISGGVMAGLIIASYFIAFILCMLLDMVVTKILGCAFGLEVLAPFDLIFILQEEPKNIENYIGAIFFDKYDAEEWKKNLLLKLENIHRCKAKIVRKFGAYWFKEMTDQEWQLQKDLAVQIIPPGQINNKEELSAWMTKECCVRDPLDGVQYRLFLIPEFEKEEGNGVFILKAHHSFADGLAAMQFFGALADVYDKDTIVGMKPIPLAKKIVIWVCLPFVTLIEGVKLLTKFGDRNPIKKQGLPLTGKKNGWYSNDLDIAGIKAYTKEVAKCTVNDYTTALLSTALHEYCSNHLQTDDKMPQEICAAVPFSLREAPSDLKNVRLNNDFCCISIPIRLFKDFDSALKNIKSLFNSLKRSLMPFANFMVFRITTNLPYCFPKIMVDFVSNKYTMIYSNLNASKKPLVIGGQPSKGQFYFVPAPGKMSMGISIITIADKMRLAVYADESFMPDLDRIKEFISIYEKQNLENLKQIHKEV